MAMDASSPLLLMGKEGAGVLYAPSTWPWLSLGDCCNPSWDPCSLGTSAAAEFSVGDHALVLSQTVLQPAVRGEEETTLQDALVVWGSCLCPCPHAAAWSRADGAGAMVIPRAGEPAPREAESCLLWELQGLFTLYTLSSCSAGSHLVSSLLL